MKTASELIVLHTTKFGESSLVIHTLSREYGRRSFLVKNVGRKAAMSLFLPMNIIEADIIESPRAKLYTARNLSSAHPLVGIRNSIGKNSITLFLSEVLYRVIKDGAMEPGLFYNVNVPNVPTGELRGVKLVRKGKRRYHDKITVIKTPFGGEAYWVGGRIEDDMAEDTDVFAVAHGFASVTPVHLEMTSFAALEKISALDMEREVNAALGKN